MIANVALVGISLLVGWLALAPARRALGAPLYHLAAYPVGVMGWSFVAALCSVAGRAPNAGWTAAGLALYAGTVAALSLPFRGTRPRTVTWRSYAVFGAAFAGLALFLGWWGLTEVGFDSYSHYELSGWYLADTGDISVTVIAMRNVLVPALHMANRVLGADWAYLVYPMFSLNALALLGWALWSQALRALAPAWRAAAAALACAVMALTPAWLFHTWLVHSNMVSALYLTLAIVALVVASGGFDDGQPLPAAVLVAGLAVAGLSLSRPDGLAYAFQPLAVLALCHLSGWIDGRGVISAYASALAPLAVVYGAALYGLGVWASDKLSGQLVLGLFAAIAVFAAVTLIVPRLRLPAWISGGDTALRVAVLANLAVVAFVAREKGFQFVSAVENMAANLLLKGGWGLTWYALAFAALVSLVFPVGSPSRWRPLLLYAVFQFFTIAAVVHGWVHPGRAATMDSFNRVALHVLPLAFWYAAAYAGDLLSQGPPRRARTSAEERSQVEAA